MANKPNAILAISSTDRYVTNVAGKVNQPVSSVLDALYDNKPPYANDFQITAPNALMNGYIDKIIVSQIQIQYNVPTIIPGSGSTQGNDTFALAFETSVGSGVYSVLTRVIPYGFYTPLDLAAILQYFLQQLPANPNDITVQYGINFVYSTGNRNAFTFTSISGRRLFFPSPDYMRLIRPGVLSENQLVRLLKMYRLLGITTANFNPSVTQTSSSSPQFLYTPYIDIYSDNLTNYQKLKDTDSSVSKRKGLVSRLYLSGVGNPQNTFAYNDVTTTTVNLTTNGSPNVVTGTLVGTTPMDGAFGSQPFVITYDLNNPKVIGWSPDTAINSLDFQLRDCYGDLLFCALPYDPRIQASVFNTEWQMTLLCVEKKY